MKAKAMLVLATLAALFAAGTAHAGSSWHGTLTATQDTANGVEILAYTGLSPGGNTNVLSTNCLLPDGTRIIQSYTLTDTSGSVDIPVTAGESCTVDLDQYRGDRRYYLASLVFTAT